MKIPLGFRIGTEGRRLLLLPLAELMERQHTLKAEEKPLCAYAAIHLAVDLKRLEIVIQRKRKKT